MFAVSWLLGPRAYVWSFRDDPIARSLRSARPRLHFPAYSWYWPFWPFSPTAIQGVLRSCQCVGSLVSYNSLSTPMALRPHLPH